MALPGVGQCTTCAQLAMALSVNGFRINLNVQFIINLLADIVAILKNIFTGLDALHQRTC